MNPSISSPNVLLLTIDTLRADLLGCYGYPNALTPNLDRLASQGIRFNQAITGGSWTQAAFPVLLTSTPASSFGGCLGPLAPERPSPVEVFSRSGYRTFGLSSNPLLSRKYGYDRGFGVFEDLKPGEKDPPLRQMKGGQFLLRSPLFHALSGRRGKNMRPARKYVSAERLNARAMDLLAAGEGPSFGWIHYMDVHWPCHLQEDLATPRQIAQAWTDIIHLHRVNWKHAAISPEQRDRYLDLYEKAVRYVDGQIGRLLDGLQERGLAENTIVVVLSDHGEEFLERGRWGHFETNLYDEILKVPLIFRLPGRSGGSVVRSQVRTLDIMPTLLQLCGIPRPAGLEGRSLKQLWTVGENALESGPAVSEMWRDHWHIIAVRTEAFKYIWNSRTPEQPKLFDLQQDPQETENVIAQYPDTAHELQDLVDQRLADARRTRPEKAQSAPEHDGEMIARLRDLGYLE